VEGSDDFWKAVRELVKQHEEVKLRARGRRGPRSRLVDAIFVMLLAKPMRASELAGILGYETRYISSYLSYWRSRGYVDYENGLWYLTPLGEEYAREVLDRESNDRLSEFIGLARRILLERDSVAKAMNSKKTRGSRLHTGQSLPFIAKHIGKHGNEQQERTRKANCALEVLSEDLTEEEFDVMRALLDHYARWGTTYLYLDQLQEEMQADYTWLMKALRSLQAKGLVYIYKDRNLGMRIGLAKYAKEALQNCL